MTNNFIALLVLLFVYLSIGYISTTDLLKQTWNDDDFGEGDELLRKILAKKFISANNNKPPSSLQMLLPGLLKNLMNNSGVYNLSFPQSPLDLAPERPVLFSKKPFPTRPRLSSLSTTTLSVETSTYNVGDFVFELFNETFRGKMDDFANRELLNPTSTVSTTTNKPKPIYRSYQKDGRRPHLWFVNMRTDTERQRCYYCGFDEGFIPRRADCFGAFDSYNASALSQVRRNRAICNNDKIRRYDVEYWPGHTWVYSRSISNFRTQSHGSGCFKYYLDVGQVYTMRGCKLQDDYKKKKSTDKTNTALFTWGRYRALEKMLVAYQKKHKVYDNCMVSPHASLTPFARGISLWARYYVCLCYTDYCNAATKFVDLNFIIVLLVLLYVVIK